MRIALWVVIVAVHLLVIWVFTAPRRVAREEEPAFATLLMLPEPLRSQPRVPTHEAPTQHGATSRAPPPEMAPVEAEQPPAPSAAAPAPDWRVQAEVTAELQAGQIVADEDDARRRANALTAPYKPMPGPHVPGPAFGWDPTPRRQFTPIGQGAYVLPIGDQCALVIVIIPMIGFGCSLGKKPAANGDLFKYMHGPVKYGDWDWRVKDP